MKMFLAWLRTAALTLGLVLGPVTAFAAYNLIQNPNASTGFLDSFSQNGIQAMTFIRGNNRIERTTGVGGTGTTSWSFDEKEYTMFFADLGTASSAVFAVPTTGVITRVDLAWGTQLTSAAAVMNMQYAPASASGGFHAAATAVTAFSLTAPTTGAGGRVTDDLIFKSVNLGDLIGIGTNGGPGNAVPGHVTIHIRPQ